LVVGPLLSAWGGLPGIFWITSVLAVGGIAVVMWWTPAEVPGPPEMAHSSTVSVWTVLRMPDLARLNLGVFILYTVQLATWVAVPALLIQAGVEKSLHGWVYLPAVLLSFVVMGATLFPMERRGRLRPLFLVSIASVMLVQAALIWQTMGTPTLAVIGFLLFVFFCGFNVLEASQPSLASRLAPAATRGTVLGIYNTLQSLGIFAGGALGGWLAKSQGAQGLFMACALLMALWLVVAWGMAPPRPTAPNLATDHTQA
jgi:predicted MFS family arabinose efflux permease